MSEEIDADLMDLEENELEERPPQEVEHYKEDEDSPIRSNALVFNGVDLLSSKALRTYLDHYLKDSVASIDQRINTFYLEWVNDSCVCAVFEDKEACDKALVMLTEKYEDIESLEPTQERSAKSYYFEGAETNEEITTSNIKLQVRVALKTDKKEKNASEKSRYYLLHGEPKPTQRPRGLNSKAPKRGGHRQRENYRRSRLDDDNEPDLFADKLPSIVKRSEERNGRIEEDEEEDLFPNFVPRTRSRSPTR